MPQDKITADGDEGCFYLVTGVTKSGNRVKVAIPASSEDEAAKLAREQKGIFPTDIREQGGLASRTTRYSPTSIYNEDEQTTASEPVIRSPFVTCWSKSCGDMNASEAMSFIGVIFGIIFGIWVVTNVAIQSKKHEIRSRYPHISDQDIRDFGMEP